MALVVNGVTIPENIADALMVNGISITQVVANGVQVWLQNLNLNWSGDSTTVVLGTYPWGFSTSGNLIRSQGSSYLGAWVPVSSSGVFSNVMSVGGWVDLQGIGTSALRLHGYDSDSFEQFGDWIPYTFSTKSFSGNSQINGGNNISQILTSGGLLKAYNANWGVNGAWISLT